MSIEKRLDRLEQKTPGHDAPRIIFLVGVDPETKVGEAQSAMFVGVSMRNISRAEGETEQDFKDRAEALYERHLLG